MLEWEIGKVKSTEGITKMNKNIFILLFMFILIAPLVSSWEFDNVKSYNSDTQEVIVKNAFGLGGDIGKVKLNTPLNVIVPRGYQQIAEVDMFAYEDYGKALKEFEFEDLKNQRSKINRVYDIKNKTYEDVLVDDYILVEDGIFEDGSKKYKRVKTGSHYEKEVVWKKIDSLDLKKGENITIGIFTNVQKGDYVDWIPSAFGQKVTEWATWTESYNVGIVSYFKLDENAGAVIDSTGYNDGVAMNGTTQGADGYINTAYDLERDNENFIDLNAGSYTFGDYKNITFTAWIKMETYSVAYLDVIYSDREPGNWFAIRGDADASNKRKMGFSDSTSNVYGNTLLNAGQWYHIAVVIEEDGSGNSDLYFYLNGSSDGVRADSILPINGVHSQIGQESNFGNSGYYFDGIIDEIGIWNRSLNSTEIYDIWNDGLTYTGPYVDQSPNATLISPENTTNYTTSPVSIDFTCYGSDDLNLTTMEFYLNGTLTETNESEGAYNDTNFIFTQSLGDGTYNWSCRASDNDTHQTDSETWFVNIDTTPFIEFVTPPTLVNNSNTSEGYFPMNVSVTTPYFENITYLLINTNGTEYSQFYSSEIYYYNFTDMPDGTYDYNVTVCTTTSQCNSTETRRLNSDRTSPIIEVHDLSDLQTVSLPVNSTWHFNVTDAHNDTCYYNATGVATNIIECNSTINTTWTTGGIKSLTYCANDTFGNEECNTTTINVYDFLVVQSGKSFVGEGEAVPFTLNISSTSFPIGDASANLWWNDSNEGVTTKTVVDANTIRFLKTFNIPDGTGNATGNNISWYWNYNATHLSTRNSTTQSQSIYAMNLSDCEIASGYVILNLSLRDEEANTLVNMTPPNDENIELDLKVTSLTNGSLSWNFSKAWTNNSVAVCVPNGLLNNTEYRIEFTVGFDSTDNVREFYYLDNGTLDDSEYFNPYTSKYINLMDLLSADSTTFLFEYTDENNQRVDDIIVHTFRKYIGEGLFREVERSRQDNSGQTHVHLVEEDVIYYFMITQYGEIIFTSETYNAKCLSTPCEITLSASPTEQNWSIIDNEGGRYVIVSDKDTRTVTTTFQIDEISLVNVSLYKLWNSSGVPELANTSSLTSTSGSIDFFIPYSYENTTYFVTVHKNNGFVKSVWISMEEGAIDYFGTFGAILGGLVVLAMMLMAITEGVGFIVVTILALLIIGFMQLIDLGAMAIISIVCAGGVIVFKLVNKRRGG